MNIVRWLGLTIVLILVRRESVHGADIPGSVSDDKFFVGVILPFTGGWEIGGWIASAVDIAIQRIKELKLLSGYNIEYEVKDSSCDSKQGMKVALDFHENSDDIDAYVGGGCSEVCKHVSLLASAWNLPLVSFGCNSNELSNKFDYPTFVRTVGVWTGLAGMFDAICDYYGWDRVGILATSESILQLTRVAIEEYLSSSQDHRPKQVFHETLESTYKTKTLPDKLAEATRALKRLSSKTKVFILLLYNHDIRNILMAAWDNGLISSEYAYITIELDMKMRNWPERRQELFQASNGLFSINLRKPTGGSWDEFSRKVVTGLHTPKFNSYDVLPLEAHDKVPVHAGTLHDAMLLWANGVNKSIAAGQGPDDGRNITKQLFDIDVEGILGRIHIDSKGDRKADHSFSILQSDGFHDLLVWSSHRESLMPLVAPPGIKYMGNSTTPSMGRPHCGWDSEYCKSVLPYALPAALAGFFVILAGIIVLLYRRMKYQEELRAVFLWKVDWVEIEHRRLGELQEKNKACYRETKTYKKILNELPRETLELAEYKGLIAVIKKVDKPSIDMRDREIMLELKNAIGLRHENLCHFFGAVIDAPYVSLLMEHAERGSLQDVIQHEGVNLTWDYKLSFAYDIAKGMEYIDTGPIRFHGHLTSANCLVDGLWAVKITDYGMRSFKRGAKNISRKNPSYLLWTAPEILRTSGRTGTPKGDVYSYGIVVQEIVLEDGPYCCNDDLICEDIVEKVKMGLKFRPIVPGEACSREWRTLMEDCWNEYPNFRPTFTQIRKHLRDVNGGNPIGGMKNMVRLIEQHTEHLEKLLIERSEELAVEESKVETLFVNILPKPVANALIQGIDVAPEIYDAVTIYFSDIVGFANVTANYTATQVVETLNDIYITSEEVLRNYDVFKVEVVGDAHMIASGLPLKNDDHAHQICAMALHLLSAITYFQVNPDTKRPDFHLRIGIHTGPCVAGVVGIRLPRYLLFGETVILASRMQSKSRSLRILISDDTATRLPAEEGYQLADRGEIQIKENRVKKAYWLKGKDNFKYPLPNFD